MDSSVTGDLVNGGKLLVHIAENGHSFEIDCDESMLVETVQRFIESLSQIPSKDQLLLCLDMRLEPQKLLSDYTLPSYNREVFLFNKSRLHPYSAAPSTEVVDILEIADPPPPSTNLNSHPLDDATDPALKALPSYERQFRYHYNSGHAIYSRTQAKFQNCQRLVGEAKVQERAVEVGRANFEQYYRILSQNYLDFMRRYAQQYRYHSELLLNFGRDVERLKSCKLHPTLQTNTRKCLLDFVKGENLQKWLETCSNSHKQLDGKIFEFKQWFNSKKHEAEDLLSSNSSLPVRDMELSIKEHMCGIDEQKSIMQSLSKDVGTVKKLVDECLASHFSSSLRPHDAVSALGPMYDVHDKNHLPKMQNFHRSISKLLDFCKDRKNEMNMFVHNYMKRISYMSHVIKDAKFKFTVFKEAIRRQGETFMNLRLVLGIGPAYRACFAEVVRRKASMKLYMGIAGQLAEKLATKRELEVRRREEFLKTHCTYIPGDVLASMGLYDTPSQCDVNIAPFDSNLLDVDISDLERYAPGWLVVLPYMSEKHETPGSVTVPNDSPHAPELEKHGSQESLECSLIEIAGTSKLEVENAKLKAELASAIALVCSFGGGVEYELLDDDRLDTILMNSAKKTEEALHLKAEYEKQLKNLLNEKQSQCVTYEKRIHELEQRLSNQYLQRQKLSVDVDEALTEKTDDCKSEVLGDEEFHVPCICTSEPMDEVSYASNSLDGKLGLFPKLSRKSREGVDENMLDSSGVLNTQFDTLMPEQPSEELKFNDECGTNEMAGHGGMAPANIFTTEIMSDPLNLPCEKATDTGLCSKISDDDLLELQTALAEKLNLISETESKLNDALEQVAVLGRELELSRELLAESQMNCAHLENCLHEAREEAQTHLCAADRRASEYSALRASAVKMRSLFERLRSCVTSSGVAVLAEPLRALAQSLPNSSNDGEDDGMGELRTCIQVLADKVSFLARHRAELLERYSKIESSNMQLMEELEEKKELVKTLYAKHQFEKQASKEKISFSRLEVHEIAAFVLNQSGHYEAINRSCSNYYLSAESVALFANYLPKRRYIIGQIVHIEKKTVRPPNLGRPSCNQADQNQLGLSSPVSSNPYGLPIGSEFFVVTVAMLPDRAVRLSSPSSRASPV